MKERRVWKGQKQDQIAAENWMTTAVLSQVYTGFTLGTSLHGCFWTMHILPRRSWGKISPLKDSLKTISQTGNDTY